MNRRIEANRWQAIARNRDATQGQHEVYDARTCDNPEETRRGLPDFCTFVLSIGNSKSKIDVERRRPRPTADLGGGLPDLRPTLDDRRPWLLPWLLIPPLLSPLLLPPSDAPEMSEP